MKTSRARPQRACHGAFTLIELLVVIAIIAILASLLLPALAKAKRKAYSATCKNNFRQISTAVHLFADDNNDLLPPGKTPRMAGATQLGLGHGVRAGYDSRPRSYQQLIYHLYSYLGGPEPQWMPTYLPVFFCPANERYNRHLLKGNLADAVVYGMITELERTSSGVRMPWSPFGNVGGSGDSRQPARPRKLTEASTVRWGGRQPWMIADTDRTAYGGSDPWGAQKPTIPDTPAHGNSRNYVFFDGHVETLKIVGNGSLSAPF